MRYVRCARAHAPLLFSEVPKFGSLRGACYHKRHHFSAELVSEIVSALTPKTPEARDFFFPCLMILVLYLGHGFFFIRYIAVLFFLPHPFLGWTCLELLTPSQLQLIFGDNFTRSLYRGRFGGSKGVKARDMKNKSGAHVYRSRRLSFLFIFFHFFTKAAPDPFVKDTCSTIFYFFLGGGSQFESFIDLFPQKTDFWRKVKFLYFCRKRPTAWAHKRESRSKN